MHIVGRINAHGVLTTESTSDPYIGQARFELVDPDSPGALVRFKKDMVMGDLTKTMKFVDVDGEDLVLIGPAGVISMPTSQGEVASMELTTDEPHVINIPQVHWWITDITNRRPQRQPCDVMQQVNETQPKPKAASFLQLHETKLPPPNPEPDDETSLNLKAEPDAEKPKFCGCPEDKIVSFQGGFKGCMSIPYVSPGSMQFPEVSPKPKRLPYYFFLADPKLKELQPADNYALSSESRIPIDPIEFMKHLGRTGMPGSGKMPEWVHAYGCLDTSEQCCSYKRVAYEKMPDSC
ncbi:unnamed protein product [Vitrella brassicaformis CCMP3155]|uniref:Uncharacterized protein n=1 Tax=Vitrella brassicaformis (strain CCMP3155) TaxID=1169540 RepID=A0A0G4G0K3_VITBC|nr:unnamed protein product [Vitrella brassicaformis CCMP3155]|eukprot:CEM21523.1 unnamed protein product [Vitrella brassicaformis CCMP3155]